jgi:aspartate/methionine/tyrosine aminotransferase
VVNNVFETKLAKRTERAFKHKQTIDRRTEMMRGFSDLVDLRGGWSDEHLLPRHIIDSAKEAIDRGYDYQFFGTPELRRAISKKLKADNGLEVDFHRELLVTAGGSEAIYLALFALIDPGDEVIMADPGYVAGYVPNILMAGGRMAYVPSREERLFKVDPEEVNELVTKKTKLLLVISPDNPTGAIFDRKDLEGVAEIAVEHDLVVVSDEIFEKVIYDGKKNLSIGTFPGMENRTITINGFSKGYNMPEYRVGYVAGPETVINRMANIQLHMTASVNAVGQRAALAALEGPQDWIEEAVKTYEERRNLFVERLNKIEGVSCLKPEAGFTAFPNIEEFGMSSEEFSNYLLREAHILTLSGTSFLGSRSEGHIKIGFSRPRQTLEKALDRMEAALEKVP